MPATIGSSGVRDWISAFAERLAQERQYLTRLDADIGDADHGENMNRGFQAALARVQELQEPTIDAVLQAVASTVISKTGGASGPLYGTFFLRLGMALKGKSEASLAEWAAAVEAGLQGVKQRGKAEPGDKTMVDALEPAVAALHEAAARGAPLAEALAAATQAAREGMEATTPLVARRGRASYLGERSAGHQDPGATSTFYLLEAAERAFAKE